jgi:hypothetical protein
MKTEANNWTGMFWRFEILCDDIECVIFRDTDSRLNMREKNAVDEWLLSDKTFHIMRDHPFHGFPILGGMWGFKKNSKYNLCDLLNMWSKENAYGADYNFLSKSIYPLINDDKVVHDPFFEKKPFPTKRIDTEFVGDVFDENDIRHPSFHTNIISRS